MSDRPDASVEIRIGLGSCCQDHGSAEVYRAARAEVRALRSPATVRPGGCTGMCHHMPLVEFIRPDGQVSRYARVTPDAVPAIVRGELHPVGLAAAGKDALRRAWRRLMRERGARDHLLREDDPSLRQFLSAQVHIVTAGCGRMDPIDIGEYRAQGGYEALTWALLHSTPPEVVAEVHRSGLRGRDAAGMPTGLKWYRVARQVERPKTVLCCADEQDGGGLADRMLLEAYPHRVLEGALIAAVAVGAEEVLFYLPRRHALAVEHLAQAIAQAKGAGFLGWGILGTNLGMTARIVQSAEASVFADEDALIAAVDAAGVCDPALSGRPTLVNNAETLAAVPWILRQGAAAYAALGTPTSPGTKLFVLAGNIERPGLIEVPMGTTIRQIVMDLGGGAPEGGAFKAVQIGGSRGGCIPAELADTPIDYEALAAAGASMGSSLVVLPETPVPAATCAP